MYITPKDWCRSNWQKVGCNFYTQNGLRKNLALDQNCENRNEPHIKPSFDFLETFVKLKLLYYGSFLKPTAHQGDLLQDQLYLVIRFVARRFSEATLHHTPSLQETNRLKFNMLTTRRFVGRCRKSNLIVAPNATL